MKRVIIDHKKLSPDMASRLLKQYPQGYGDEDLISFKNPKGDWIQAVELQMPEALYLVRINQNLASLLASLEETGLSGDIDYTGMESPLDYDGSLETESSFED